MFKDEQKTQYSPLMTREEQVRTTTRDDVCLIDGLMDSCIHGGRRRGVDRHGTVSTMTMGDGAHARCAMMIVIASDVFVARARCA